MSEPTLYVGKFFEAWLGYGVSPMLGIGVRICKWCPDKELAAQEARPLPVIWTMCPRCAARVLAQQNGETNDTIGTGGMGDGHGVSVLPGSP